MVMPAHQPTENSRAAAKAMTAYGIVQPQIAEIIGISHKTLQRHYAHEISVGTSELVTKVAQSLVQKALGDEQGSVAAAIFLLKTRGRWREQDRPQDEQDEIRTITVNVVHHEPRPGPNVIDLDAKRIS